MADEHVFAKKLVKVQPEDRSGNMIEYVSTWKVVCLVCDWSSSYMSETEIETNFSTLLEAHDQYRIIRGRRRHS